MGMGPPLPYGQMGGPPPMGMGGMELLPENGPMSSSSNKGKKKGKGGERKSRGGGVEPNNKSPSKSKGKGKGKGGKNNNNSSFLSMDDIGGGMGVGGEFGGPLVPPHEVYEFQDVPPEIPERKGKKPAARKPKEKSPPKPKKAKESKAKSPPKRSRKKKGPIEEPGDESLNSSFQSGVSGDSHHFHHMNDGMMMDGSVVGEGLPKMEEGGSESDQKNGIGAAGITAADTPLHPTITSGGEIDTSTQILVDGIAPEDNTTAAAETGELTTPEKPKAKPKKPKLKSSSTGKKRPSK
jgi:hypothetical protein